MSAPDTTLDKVRVRIMDRSTSDPLLDSDALDEAFADALSHYSGDRPLALVADVTGDGTAFYPLTGDDAVLASWSEGVSRITAINFPAAELTAIEEPTWLDPDADWATYRDASLVYLRFRSTAPGAGETARVSYTGLHLHSDDADTVPAGELDALCDLAAHYACQILATKMAAASDSLIAADSTNYRDGQLRFKQQADAWLASYKDRLNLGGGGKDGAGSGVAGASANADWNRALTAGGAYLTHNRRWR